MMQTLNMIEITKVNPALAIAGIVMALLGIIMFGVFARTNKEWLSILSFLLGTILTISGVAIISVINTPDLKIGTGKYQIEVTISDDMPFNAVYDQYEIIEKRGDIYLLEPKVFDFEEEKG